MQKFEARRAKIFKKLCHEQRMDDKRTDGYRRVMKRVHNPVITKTWVKNLIRYPVNVIRYYSVDCILCMCFVEEVRREKKKVTRAFIFYIEYVIVHPHSY